MFLISKTGFVKKKLICLFLLSSKCGIIFWFNSFNSKMIFSLQNKIVRIMTCAKLSIIFFKAFSMMPSVTQQHLQEGNLAHE